MFFLKWKKKAGCVGNAILNFFHILLYVLMQTTFLLGYWKPFSVRLPGDSDRKWKKNAQGLQFPDGLPVAYCDLLHWVTKYIINIVVVAVTYLIKTSAEIKMFDKNCGD